MIEQLLFWVFAILTCGGAIAVVATQNVVRMAFWLVVSLGSVAALFFLLHADFLGAAQLLIYVGGTVVLLVFGVMLTASGPTVQIKTSPAEAMLGASAGLILLSVIMFVIGTSDWGDLHGVLVQPIDRDLATRLKLDGLSVASDSEELKAGDVLVALSSGGPDKPAPLYDLAQYEELRARTPVDAKIEMIVRRDGAKLRNPIRIRAAKLPAAEDLRERDERRGVRVAIGSGELRVDDALAAMDGIPVNGVAEYQEQLSRKDVGSVVSVTVWRDGKQLAEPVRTRIRPAGAPAAVDVQEQQLLESAATKKVAQSFGAVQSRRQAGRTVRQLGLSFFGMRAGQDLNRPAGGELSPGFLLPFEIVSIHLLVVLVGAAYLARAKRKIVPGSSTEL